MIGRVVSTKMTNTAVVLVSGTKTHPLYKKTYASSKKYLAEDPIGVAPGQIVEMIKVPPISKRKNWKITKVVGRDIEAIVSEQLQEQAAEAIEEVMPEEKETEEPSDVSHQTEKEENEKPKKDKTKKGKV